MNKKHKILLTMLELVVKQGVHGTSMSQLSRTTGIASSSIYHYFKNKQEIINEIYILIRKDFDSVFNQIDKNQTPENIFKNYWINLFHYYTSNPLAFEFHEFIARPPVISQELINETKTYYLNHTKYFWDKVKDGALKDMNLSLLVQLAVNTVVAAVSLKLNNTLEMNEHQLNDAMNAAWDLVRKIEN